MTIMKKYSFILSAAFVLFALASCQKEVEINVEKVTPEVEQTGSIPFQLVANVNGEEETGTKTTLNTSTWAVSWESTDKIYAVATDATDLVNPNWGSGTSSSDAGGSKVAEFSYSAGVFSTETEITDGEHTFNFIYTNAAQRKFHRAAGTTHQLYSSQSVNASSPTSNLKNYDAMVGTKTISTPASLATVELKHLYTLMKVTITNSTGASLTAKKFQINVDGANIAGVFNITNFATGAISLASGGTSTIDVPISNGTIANSSSIDIYFAMAPLADYTGIITFTVYDSNDQSYSRTNTISSALSFEAGKYNTANFVLTTGIKQAGKHFERITGLENLTDGDYLILGTKAVDANYGFMRYASMNSSRIPYTTDYDSEAAIPSERNISNPEAYWRLSVSGSGDSRTVTIYNTEKDSYLKCDGSGNLSWVNALAGANTNYTVTAVGDNYSFGAAYNTLNINKADGQDYWKTYAASNTNTTSGIMLFQEWEPSTLSSITLEGSQATEFYVGSAFNYDGLLVKAHYANSSTRYVKPDSVTEGGVAPNMSSARDDVVITVSYTEGAVTKTATYTIDIVKLPGHTVTWKVGSTTIGTDVGAHGSALLLHAAPSAGELSAAGFSGKTFIGWTSAATINSNGTGITYASTSDTVDDDITYYAVVATADGDPVVETVNIGTYASTNSWTNSSQHTTITSGDLTLTANNTSNGKFYTKENSWRFYSGGSCTVSTPVGCVLNSIVLTWVTTAASVPTGWTADNTATSPTTYTAGMSARSNQCVLARGSGNVLITEISVNYTQYSGYTK